MKLWVFECSNFKSKKSFFDDFFIFSFIVGMVIMGFVTFVFFIGKGISMFLFGEWNIFGVLVFGIWFCSFMLYVLKWSDGFVKRCFIEMEAIE